VRARFETDGRLVARVRAGSADAAGELVRRHLRRAWRAALAVCGSAAVADDIAQDAFVSALRSLDRFDEERDFGPWIAKIAVNRALDSMRRAPATAALGDVEVIDEAAAAELAAALGGDDLAHRVAILPAGQRAVIVLRYWHDLRPVDVAEALGIPEGTVHSREKRALDLLRTELGVAT
jgi:RNA polymerase sigma-70 factor (ECF subfamily)